jgi:hypothetical protein
MVGVRENGADLDPVRTFGEGTVSACQRWEFSSHLAMKMVGLGCRWGDGLDAALTKAAEGDFVSNEDAAGGGESLTESFPESFNVSG